MLKFNLNASDERGLHVLCLGAHCDDIEIGCGGALIALQNHYNIAEIDWVVFASNETRKKETLAAAAMMIDENTNSTLTIHDFQDAYLRKDWEAIKGILNALPNKLSPDIIFTHCGHDKHQDHRLISELTWNAFRNHLILEYEIPKFDGDLRQPNIFIPISEKEAKRKVGIIMDAYQSQASHHWFEPDTFYALMRIRGLECGGDQKYAEGFYVRKAIL